MICCDVKENQLTGSDMILTYIGSKIYKLS